MAGTRYLRQIPSNRIFVYSEQMAARNDMVAYAGDIKDGYAVETPASVIAPVKAAGLDPRMASLIKNAALSIPSENWSQPVGKKPAVPKVKDVGAILGFPVSLVELLQAMGETPEEAGEEAAGTADEE